MVENLRHHAKIFLKILRTKVREDGAVDITEFEENNILIQADTTKWA